MAYNNDAILFDKEALYQEFVKNHEQYPTLISFYRHYYLKVRHKGDPAGYEKAVNNENALRTFHRYCRGFLKRRTADLKKQTETFLEEQAKQEASMKASLKLKNYALGAEGYLEDFKMIREGLRYALKRMHIRIKQELEKLKNNPDYEPKPVTLNKAELMSIRIYTAFFETMRTTLKLPVRYSVNYEAEEKDNSIGGLMKTIQEYRKSGGTFEKQTEIEIERVQVEFDREEARQD